MIGQKPSEKLKPLLESDGRFERLSSDSELTWGYPVWVVFKVEVFDNEPTELTHIIYLGRPQNMGQFSDRVENQRHMTLVKAILLHQKPAKIESISFIVGPKNFRFPTLWERFLNLID